MKMLIAYGFVFAIFGQFLMGVGACFMVNTTLPFCSNWYTSKERPLALSILSIMNILGGGFGNFIPILFVNPLIKDHVKIRGLVNVYNLTIALLWGILMISNLLWFKGKPEYIDETHNKTKRQAL